MSVRTKEEFAEAPAVLRRATARDSWPAVALRDARLLLIALWLGGAVFFSFVVAPSAFSVLPSRALAGAVVNRTLGVINTGGVFVSLALLASAFFARGAVSRLALRAEAAALAVLGVTGAVGRWVIAARLEALRVAMGRPVDEVPLNDPLRVAFGSLHGYSVMVLLIGMIAALAALLLIAHRPRS